jgi:hypothetical protein
MIWRSGDFPPEADQPLAEEICRFHGFLSNSWLQYLCGFVTLCEKKS